MAQLAQDRRWSHSRNAQSWSSYPADWYIEDDEPVAQSVEHQLHEFNAQSRFLAWKERTNQEHLLIGCELACRWDSNHPGVGIDPDVYVVSMPPRDPKTGNIYRLRTWESGNEPPLLAIEIVSKSRPGKDYSSSPTRHDLLGTFELWVFDPDMSGYCPDQPPVPLQVFQRETNHRLVKVYAGPGPFFSDAVDAWVMVIDAELVIADDAEGKNRWPTLEEAAQRRADAEAERANAERDAKLLAQKRADDEAKRADNAQVEKEKALARIAELEAMLAKRS